MVIDGQMIELMFPHIPLSGYDACLVGGEVLVSNLRSLSSPPSRSKIYTTFSSSPA